MAEKDNLQASLFENLTNLQPEDDSPAFNRFHDRYIKDYSKVLCFMLS